MDVQKNLYQKIYEEVANIPKGSVATYGQIAARVGSRFYARQVGYALSALPETTRIPWHRVVNQQGKISRRSFPDSENVQRQLLESEGVCFSQSGKIDLKKYRCAVLSPLRGAGAHFTHTE
ncbi:MAG: MGMT family protein [Bdellovibrionota bacterium]